ncbi:SMI1/KNR4 family protein [Brevibacillus dissolubilis]|uniref:SMI1/KNR4 family protein n=1 Tax=Brevibacillus dissolubilis TaxID=1844116 RepID=UPI00111603C3|nr:SMI1/KNR4 family protein [Brevibacillus dissolubilis]
MARYDYLKPYIVEPGKKKVPGQKHVFYPLSAEEIQKEELRLGRPFPAELREFYLEVGYGFLSKDSGSMVNRIMDPASVVDYYLGEDDYEDDMNRELVEDDQLPFFEVSEVLVLGIDFDSSESGANPVRKYGYIIENSLEDFLRNCDEEADYYLDK